MENSIYDLNKKLLAAIDQEFLGLANGKMGLCIYFYHLARSESVPEYEEIAEKLLDQVLENISVDTCINVEAGLAGIAIGMNYLMEEGFIEGDINSMLEEIDDIIFQAIVFTENDMSDIVLSEIVHLLYYFYIRYKTQTEKDKKYIFEELIIKVVEVIYKKLTPQFWEEPLSFSFNYNLPRFLYIIGKIISLDIYNYRIYKILDELHHKIVGSYPVSQANRLFLLWGLTALNSKYSTPTFVQHIQLLKEKIDIDYILFQELGNKRIFLSNGVSLVYFLLSQLKKIDPVHSIDFDINKIYKKVVRSEAWDSIGYDPWENRTYYHGFLTGIPAPVLVLSFIRKNNGYEN